jgi:LPS export ABC transporter protein LptC
MRRRLPRMAAARSSRAVIARLALSAVLAAAVAACSLDYGDQTEVEQQPQGIPDTVAIGLVHRVNNGGRLNVQMEASRAESYSSTNLTILSDAHFTEFDDKGALDTEGQAAHVVFHNDSQDAEISGSVRVYSATEKANILAKSLSWTDKEKRLTADPGETVVMKKDDGSYISGSGFLGDFRRRQLVFDGPVQGKYVWTEKNE